MKEFETPMMEVIRMTAEDVIATSGGSTCPDYTGDDEL